MSSVVQRSMSGGEVSDSLQARVDTVKYATGLKTMRNTWTKRDGGSQNRPGTQYLGRIKDHTSLARLIPFIISDDVAYIVEFTDEWFRFYSNGYPLVSAITPPITAITNAAHVTVSVAAADSWFADGQEVYIQSVVGMTELNNNIYLVSDVGSGSMKLKDQDGNYVNSTLFAAYASGGTLYPVISGTHPYSDDELADIQYVQSSDTLTLTHPSHPVQELAAPGQYSYSAEALGFAYGTAVADLAPGVEECIVAFTLSAPTNGAFTYRYCVTAVLEDGEETPPLINSAGAASNFIISAITKANPAVLTVGSTTGVVDGDLIYISGVRGMTEINGRYYTADVIDATTLSINADSTLWGTFAANVGSTTEQIYLCSKVDTTSAVPTNAAPNVIGALVAPATPFKGGRVVAFNVYLNSYGIYGFIGTTSISIFNDTGFALDPAINPPEVVAFHDHSPYRYDDAEHLTLATNVPSAVVFSQQRRGFANFTDDSELIVLSQIGRYHNFTRSFPLVDSDSIKAKIAGKKISSVKHMIDMGRLLIFTASGEFSADGNASGVVTPTEVNIKHHSSFGSSNLSPIVIDGEAFFVQRKGGVVRNISFNFDSDGFRGNDLTSFATHLFEGHTIVDWTYQNYPNSIIWAVRDDGVLLGLTYVREQQILSWHHHDFSGGTIENVCCIPEGDEDVLYVVVKRTIDGSTKRYLERMHTRLIDEDAIEDSIFVDSSLSYDGRNTSAIHTMTMSGAAWEYNDTVTLTSSASFFKTSDVGNEIHIDLIDDDEDSDTFGEATETIRFRIKAFSSATVVTGKPDKTVPVTMRATPISDWARAVDEVRLLDHLEGESVSVFADGFVVANPNNSKYAELTVTDGVLELDKCYGVIHVGLPVTADLQFLDIDTANGETIANKDQLISEVTAYLEKTRGGWVGPKPPPDESADYHGGLIEFKPRSTEGYEEPASLKTGKYTLQISSEWKSSGGIFIRQSDPLPMSVLAMIATGSFPFRG